MSFDFTTLEPQIHQILSAPGTDLTTISAKRVRRQLLESNPSLTAEFLKENKEDVDAVIASVFEKVSAAEGANGNADDEDSVPEPRAPSRKRKQEGEDVLDDVDDEEDDEETPPPKKAKKARKNGQELTDAELARKLSSEINSRSLRAAGKSRGSSNGSAKRGSRAKKSAALVDSDDSDDADGGNKKKHRKKASGGGGAKGGFAKEFALSEPLAAVLQVDKLSRPQVVKQLWVYIKGNELQNPSNKREIMCDSRLKAVFGVEKIDMFKMNKVLGEHLHEEE
ncbi:hypothetical protein BDQ12DRAFT_40483 [Crucibulum laeve]|uniref:DM2 domain-containing protein n=1 Tax=Crucibulum laeve TaxID=68775 RepID=A0A5C3MKH5_9AGAR|nr:hypothetical protein BDQ12DRAFT_40483 [Crucibulum laeve]